MTKKKILAVYYSRTGSTKKVIDALQKETGCDVEVLVDKKKRKGIIGYMLSGRDAARKKLTKLAPQRYNPLDYELIVIATPVWASNMSPAIRTFIVGNEGKLPNVAYITTSGGPDEKTITNLQELGGKKPVATCNFFTKELMNEGWKDKLDKFAAELSR